MKQLTAFLLAMFMIATPLSAISVTGSQEPVPLTPFWGGGDGTPGNPYNITNVWELQNMSGDLTAHYALGNDIDATISLGMDGGSGFLPVGNSVTPFTGSLNGRYYNITNLFINRGTDDTGLFGGIGPGGQVLNVTLINFNYTGNNRIGGIVGDNNNGFVGSCKVSGKITGTAGNAGGIVGRNRVNGLVMYCSSDCDISAAGSRDGGIVGQNVGGSDILNCHSYGQVNGTRGVGGIAGYHANSGSTIKNCSSSGLIIGTDYYTGGCVGEQSTSSIIEDSKSSATVINYGANPGAGGFVGSSQFSNIIQRCGSTGDVSSSYPTSRNMGGFIGLTLYITIRDCYATGSVSGSDSVGGFVGSNDASDIERCFSSGSVSGTSRTGGFMGYNTSANATITSCFWDNETSGQAVGAWNASVPGINGNSTLEMMQESTFAGWDFTNAWVMIGDHNYPKLRGTFTPIYDVYDLQDMNNNLDADYILMNDVDAAETTGWNGGEGFMPVGNATDPYNGMFWGQGYAISNLFMSRSVTYQGLFGHISSSSAIENVNIANVSVTGWQFKAAIAGYNSGGKIYDSSCSGIIGTAGSNTGAVVGRMVGGIIDNCTTSCTVTSSNGNNIGGFAGSVYGGGIITNSSASGNVNGVDNVGGFVGAHSGDNSTINRCMASGTVSSTGKCIGGFVGQNYNGAGIYNSSATGNVSCTGPIVGILGTGGFVGSNYWSANGPTIIQFCYASGDVTGTVAVGGFVGGNGDTAQACIFDCYSLGDAHSTGTTAGGFMGSGSEGPIMRCYSTGVPSATGGGVGGFAGYVGFATASNFQNNRWDITTSAMGAPISVGNSSQIFGNTTAELLLQSTYNGSDFTNDWWMIDGQTRPFLRMEYSTEIRNSHQLQLMQMDLAADYLLANDIYLSDITEPSQMWGTSLTTGGGFVPIAYDTDSDSAYNGTPFSGSLSGNNFTISNLFINRSTDYYIGLFGYAALGTKFKDLEIEGSYVSGKGDVGLLVGCNNAGTIDNCHSTGTAKGTEGDIGGLIGWNLGGTVTNCTSHTNIPLAKRWAGGLIGYSNGLVDNCTAYGDTVGTGDWIGGLIGQMFAGTVSNCSAYGDATGINNVGGLLGGNGAVLKNSHAHGAANGTAYVGGIAGNNTGSIQDSSSSSEVNGSNSIGGLVGWNLPGSSIHNSSSIGNVSGTLYIGGLVGRNDGSVDFGYSQSTIPSSTGSVCGGLVGRNTGTVNNSHATGRVNGTTNIGGLVGWNEYGTLNNSYATGEVIGTGDYVGGLVGYNEGPVTNSHAEGDVEGSDFIAGLVGYNTADVTNSMAYGNVTGFGTDDVGGLIGYNDAATIDGCQAFGNVSGSANNMGGLIGENAGTAINSGSYSNVNGAGDYIGSLVGRNTGQLTNCTSFGDILNGHMYIGGLVGQNDAGAIFKCRAYGTIHATGSASGGLVGENGGKIENSSAYATLYGMSWAGGLAGNNIPGAIIINCTANGYTHGSQSVGGLVGGNYGEISTSYSMGTVHAISNPSHVGGLVGRNIDAAATIMNCYSLADVSGDKSVGGLVGNITNGATITNCYSAGLVIGNVSFGGLIGTADLSTVNDCFWDLNTSAQAASVNGTGKSTIEMMQQSTFNPPWDFANVWGIYEANTYPFLRAFGLPPEPEADLEITIDDIADPVQLGGVITYLVTLTNHGPDNAGDVRINITLPEGVTYINSSEALNVNGRWLTADLGALPGGLSGGTFINASVDTYTAAFVNCTANVTSVTPDPGTYPNESYELTAINRAPAITTADVATAAEGTPYTVDYDATDEDGDTLIWSVATNASAWLAMDPATGILSGTPPAGGVFWVNVTVEDGNGGLDWSNFTLVVNALPVILTTALPVATLNVPYDFQADAADPDGDALAWGYETDAAWLAMNATGYLSGTPTAAGSFWVNITVDDGAGGLAWRNFTLVVNTFPAITTTALPAAMAGQLYGFQIVATDPDGDALSWSMQRNATWLSMNSTGYLTGTPTAAGSFWVNVTVDDGMGGTAWRNYTLTVMPSVDTVPPVAHAGPNQIVTVGTVVTFTGAGSSDNVGIANFTWTFTFGGTERTLYGVSPSFNFTIVGNYTVTLTVRDPAGNTDADTVLVLVNPAAIVEPGTVTVVIGPLLNETGAPISGATVTVTYDGNTYTGTTNATGHASIEIPETALGEEISVNVTKDGYDPISYTTTLSADGTPATQPPAMDEAPPADDDDDGDDDDDDDDAAGFPIWIVILIVIIAVAALIALMLMKRGKAPVGGSEEAEPEAVEEVAPEELPAEDTE